MKERFDHAEQSPRGNLQRRFEASIPAFAGMTNQEGRARGKKRVIPMHIEIHALGTTLPIAAGDCSARNFVIRSNSGSLPTTRRKAAA